MSYPQPYTYLLPIYIYLVPTDEADAESHLQVTLETQTQVFRITRDKPAFTVKNIVLYPTLIKPSLSAGT